MDVRWLIVYDTVTRVRRRQTTTGQDAINFDFRRYFENAFPNGPHGQHLEIVCSDVNPSSAPGRGVSQRNEALDRITDDEDWVAFLDDDTLFPPDFERILLNAVSIHSNADGFVFDQLDGTGSQRMGVLPQRSFLVHVPPFPRGVDGCDTGQFIFKRKLIGATRWRLNPPHGRAPDHDFYLEIVQNNKQRVRWLNHFASIHNALR